MLILSITKVANLICQFVKIVMAIVNLLMLGHLNYEDIPRSHAILLLIVRLILVAIARDIPGIPSLRYPLPRPILLILKMVNYFTPIYHL